MRVMGPSALGPAVKGSTDSDWLAAQTDLLSARKALLAAIEKSHEESMFLQVARAATNNDPAFTAGATRADTVSGLADHDVYHLGQIAILKKSLKSR